MTRLQRSGAVFLAGFLVHNADHARRGLDQITDHVVWGGTVVAILAAVVLTLVFTDHPLAPAASFAIGFGIVAGVSATHLLPDWGVLSDSLPDGEVDALTWVAVLSEVGGAALLGAAGWQASQRARLAPSSSGTSRKSTSSATS